MSEATRIARRNALRRAPTCIVSMWVWASSMAASKRARSFAFAAAISSSRIETSDVAATRRIAAAATSATALLYRGATRGLGAEHASGLDELLDGGLIFSARL